MANRNIVSQETTMANTKYNKNPEVIKK